MKILTSISLIFLALSEALVASILPSKLTCEYLKDPMIIDISNPRLSWINIDLEYTRNQSQSSWQIRVATSREDLLNDKADLWNSGKVVSPESTNIIYNGKPLISRQD